MAEFYYIINIKNKDLDYGILRVKKVKLWFEEEHYFRKYFFQKIL